MKQYSESITIKGDAKIDESAVLDEHVTIDATEGAVVIEGGAHIEKGTEILGAAGATTKIGAYAHIGEHARIRGSQIGAYATVKDEVMTGREVYVGDYSIVEAKTVLNDTAKVPSRAVASGSPFSIVRGLTQEELDEADGRRC